MKKITRLLAFSWLVLAGAAGSPTPCFANSAVVLKPDFEINHVAVKLSDLFVGVPAEIDRDIAQAPLPCKPAVYNQAVLNKLADTYRLDWQPQNNVDHITITSACTRITADMIRDAVVDRLKATGDARKQNFEIAFDTRNLEVDLPANQHPDFKLENFSYDTMAKKFRADLTADTPHGPYSLPVTGRVMIKRSVPVLTRRMETGSTIAAQDLDWIQVPEERISADVITESDQLIGREVRRDTAEGEILRAHDVIPQRLVVHGTLITMKIETPYITITSQGKAQQDGAIGDTVRVLNTQSNRIVEGTVTAPGTVEIRTVHKLASAE